MILLAVLTVSSALWAAAGPDASYPKAWPDADHRQAAVNAQLAELGWPYRAYQSVSDGSCLAARRLEGGKIESARVDKDKKPVPAFGCEALGARARQELSVRGDMVVLRRDDGDVFTAAEDPYDKVGRYVSSPERLEIYDRARVIEILKFVRPDQKTDYFSRVAKELDDKIHLMGDGKMTELVADAGQGKWRYGVKTADQAEGAAAEPFFVDGQPPAAAGKTAEDLDDDDDGD